MNVLGKCNVISLNVRGLRNRVKRRSIFCFLKIKIVTYFFYKRRTLNRTMKIFGTVNGEVTCSFHMDQYRVEVFVSC